MGFEFGIQAAVQAERRGKVWIRSIEIRYCETRTVDNLLAESVLETALWCRQRLSAIECKRGKASWKCATEEMSWNVQREAMHPDWIVGYCQWAPIQRTLIW